MMAKCSYNGGDKLDKKWKELRSKIKPQFKAEVKDDKTVLILSGDVVSNEYSWYEDDISPKRIQAILDESPGELVIRLNSGGGDAFAGVEIYNMLKDYPNKVTVEVTGLAASAASIVAMGADEIIMCTGSMMMIHEAWTFAVGSKSDLQKTVDMMDKLDASLVSIYAERLGLDKDFVSELLKAETWMTAEEAVKDGFADSVKTKPVTQATVEIEIADEIKAMLEDIKMMKADFEGLKDKPKGNNLQRLFNKGV